MICLLLHGLSILSWIAFGSTQIPDIQSFPPNCTSFDISPKYLEVVTGWPYKFLFESFTNGDDIYDWYDIAYPENLEELDDDESVLCNVWSENGTLLFNETATKNDLDSNGIGYILEDFQEGSPTNFTVALYRPRIGRCLSSNIQLNVKLFRQKTCQDILSDPDLRQPTVMKGVHSPSTPFCARILNSQLFLEQGARMNWGRNCSSLPEGVSVKEERRNQLLIPDLTFDQAGIYDCSITYKGMTRYISTQPVCVQHKRIVNVKPIISCKSSIVEKNVGKDVTFSCKGSLGAGQAPPDHAFYFQWRKELQYGNLSESTRCPISNKASKERVSCYYENEKPACYLHVASEEEREKPFAIFPFVFTIHNITERDYGTYIFELHSKARGRPFGNTSVVLEKNPNQGLQEKSIIVGVFIAFFCTALVFVGVIGYNWLYVKVYWKRYFGGYIADNKMYGAFLCYNFSHDIDAFAQKDVKASITMVRDLLEGLGYNVYDERRDGFTEESKAENIQQSIKQSHRIVVLLSLELIKDGWGMSTIQAGFNEMIQSGSKLIFILLPGMKEYLKQHQYDGDESTKSTCMVINRAMKLNYVISWSNKTNFNKVRFRFEIEDAMPKLMSQKISSTEKDYVDLEKHDYRRCISNETTVTDIDIPRFQGMLESVSEHDDDVTSTRA